MKLIVSSVILTSFGIANAASQATGIFNQYNSNDHSVTSTFSLKLNDSQHFNLLSITMKNNLTNYSILCKPDNKEGLLFKYLNSSKLDAKDTTKVSIYEQESITGSGADNFNVIYNLLIKSHNHKITLCTR